MSGLAARVNWNQAPVGQDEMTSMLASIAHRGPNGSQVGTHENVGFGFNCLALSLRDQSERQPVWLPGNTLGAAGDIRLYNRAELLARFGTQEWMSSPPSNLEIVVAGYQQTGADIFSCLTGDFALIIYDRDRQRVIGAKDPFGLKPLFYSKTANSLMFASEPKQLLSGVGVSNTLDDIVVGEHLLNNYEDGERTFFEDIKRVKPGHVLIGTPTDTFQRRYWMPETKQKIRYQDHQEYFDEFRERLAHSVHARLHGLSSSAVALLSGGLDSTSIVQLAADSVSRGNLSSSALATLSVTFGEHECDETAFIKSLTRQIPFTSHSFQAPDDPEFKEIGKDFFVSDSPIVDIQRSRLKMTADRIHDIGGRAVLTGVGGDELLTEQYFLVDLAQRRRYRQLWSCCRDMNRFFGQPSALVYLGTALRQTAPETLKRCYRRLKPRLAEPLPAWLNEDFAARYSQFPEVDKSVPLIFTSRMQKSTFDNFIDPFYHLGLETWEYHDAHNGLEPRHPFLDRELAEFVFRVPFEVRIPDQGRWKYLLRRAMEGQLPDELLARKEKTVFDSYICGLLSKALPDIKSQLFDQNNWASEAHIDKNEAKRIINRYNQSKDVAWFSGARPVWTIASFELWCRHLVESETTI